MSTQTQNEERLVYRVYQTVLEMLSDRGWKNIPSVPDFENFKSQYNNKNLDIDIAEDDKSVYIHFNNDTKSMGKSALVSLVQKIKADNDSPNLGIIIITREKISSGISKLVSEEKEKYKNIEFFLFDDLFINKTHYVDCPVHILLTDEEKKGVMEHYHLKENQLSKIRFDSPICRYYGAKLGQVFKIIRYSPTAGESVFYRIVR